MPLGRSRRRPCHALVASHPANGPPRRTIQTPRRAVASKLAGMGPLHTPSGLNHGSLNHGESQLVEP